MEDKIKECKNLSVDDCCMELDPCGLTPCQHIKDCYYKQLLAEQAKCKKLVEVLTECADGFDDDPIVILANQALNDVNK